MAETLLPCPFCGGEPHVVPTHVSGGAEFAEVVCYDCYASVPCEREFATEGESVRSAAIAWNRRAERTCRVDSSLEEECDHPVSWFEYELSCGHSVSLDSQIPPSYCPECGRKVVCDVADYV